MTLIVLNRRPIVGDLAGWLQDFDKRVVLVTARSVATEQTLEAAKGAFSEVVVLDEYDHPDVEPLLVDLARRFRADRILSSAEADVLRAARVRERLGLPGQSMASATAFRDKYVMKTLVGGAGLPVAPMQPLDSHRRLREFSRRHGFPVVVKPAAGGGSVGVKVLRTWADVERFKSLGRERNTSAGSRMIMEAWIEGDFFTIDGLMQQGVVLHQWPSRTVANLSAVRGPRPLMSGMLREDDPLVFRITDFVARAIAALPPTDDVTAFHAEAFLTHDDRLVLCEIACRPGGCGHVPVYERAFGVNLYRATLRGQAGEAPGHARRAGPLQRLAGFGWFPPRAGILLRIPDMCPTPSVYYYETSGVVGQRYAGASSVSDSVARALLDCPPGDDIDPAIEELETWWRGATVWG